MLGSHSCSRSCSGAVPIMPSAVPRRQDTRDSQACVHRQAAHTASATTVMRMLRQRARKAHQAGAGKATGSYASYRTLTPPPPPPPPREPREPRGARVTELLSEEPPALAPLPPTSAQAAAPLPPSAKRSCALLRGCERADDSGDGMACAPEETTAEGSGSGSGSGGRPPLSRRLCPPSPPSLTAAAGSLVALLLLPSERCRATPAPRPIASAASAMRCDDVPLAGGWAGPSVRVSSLGRHKQRAERRARHETRHQDTRRMWRAANTTPM